MYLHVFKDLLIVDWKCYSVLKDQVCNIDFSDNDFEYFDIRERERQTVMITIGFAIIVV